MRFSRCCKRRPMKQLDALQKDAIAEIFNISMGRAADSLSRMVREPVGLSIPEIVLSHRSEAAGQFSRETDQIVCAVIQRFEGPFSADAVLMFPEKKSLELVRLFIGEDMPLDAMTNMEQEAMSEIGNIILNSCVGAMANLFHAEFRGGLPRVQIGSFTEILESSPTEQRQVFDANDLVLTLFIEFIIEQRAIDGYVAFMLDLPSAEELEARVNQFIARIGR